MKKNIFNTKEITQFIISKHKKFNHGTGLCISSYEAAKKFRNCFI